MKIAHVALLGAVALLPCTGSRAQTFDEAMRHAYQANPDLNARRAGPRAIDEGVPQALAGYRPTLSLVGDAALQDTTTWLINGRGTNNSNIFPRGVSFQASLPVFNGFKTRNAVRSAEASVRAGREGLRQQEQSTLQEAATAYMDVLRDS